MNKTVRYGLIVGIFQTGLCLCALGCAGAQSGKTIAQEQKAKFSVPEIPVTLNTPEARAEYLAVHYWDEFDFADTTLISKPEIIEQAFADFVNMLPYTPRPAENIARMFDRSTVDSGMFAHFRDLAEKYLYDPNSPMRNEELYIPVLEYILASDKVDSLEKIRPQYQLEMARRNRPGMMAADFTYTLANGKSARMSALQSDYTILFFNNPDCEDCKRVKEYLAASPVIASVAGKKNERVQGRQTELSILAVYVDGDIPLWRNADYPKCMINAYDASQTIQGEQLYDLKAIPTLYLLDKDKRVILKDVPVETVAAWLSEHVIDGI